MGAEARIKVRLNTDGAKRDLAELRGQMARTQVMQAPGMGAGGGGAASGAGAAGGGGGMFGNGLLGKVLVGIATAAFVKPSIETGFALGGSLLGGPAGKLEEFAFGGLRGTVKGAERAAGEVSSQLGLARGLGLVSDKSAMSLFEAIKPIRQAEARGKRELDVMFGWDNTKGTFSAMVDRVTTILTNIEEGIKRIPGVG